jgi:serine protease Do
MTANLRRRIGRVSGGTLGLGLAIALATPAPAQQAADEPSRVGTFSVPLVLTQAQPGATHTLEAPDRFEADSLTINGFQRFLLTTFHDPADATLGATLEPVDDPLRVQLGLPADQGVMVTAVAGDGPAARAGLEENDILLTLADKPLGKAEDLSEQLKVAGESPVVLRLIRKGKPLSVKVRPVYRVTLDAADKEATDSYIGVMVETPGAALLAHLGLPEGTGLIATRIVPGSPAEKAGVKTHDLLLELGGKPLDRTETLVAQVQAAGDRPVTLKLLRAGKPLTIDITPERRVVANAPRHGSVHYWTLHDRPQLQLFRNTPLPPAGWNAPPGATHPVGPDPTTRRLDALDSQMKALRQAVDELREALKTPK